MTECGLVAHKVRDLQVPLVFCLKKARWDAGFDGNLYEDGCLSINGSESQHYGLECDARQGKCCCMTNIYCALRVQPVSAK